MFKGPEVIESRRPGLYSLCSALCDALGKIGDPKAWDALFQTASYGYYSKAARLSAIQALGRLGEAEGRELIEGLLENQTDEEITSAVRATLSALDNRHRVLLQLRSDDGVYCVNVVFLSRAFHGSLRGDGDETLRLEFHDVDRLPIEIMPLCSPILEDLKDRMRTKGP